MPFAGFKNFKDCVSKNQDKRNPEAYCGSIQSSVEGTKERALEEVPVELNNRLGHYGETHIKSGEPEKIVLNPKAGDLVNTIIHENLHAENPNKPHDKVYQQADKIEGKMSLPEQASLLLETQGRVAEKPKSPLTIHHTTASKVVSRVIGSLFR